MDRPQLYNLTEGRADAVLSLMRRYSAELHIEVGTGIDMSVRELAGHVARVAGSQGEFVHDPSKPGGMPRKVVDASWLHNGFSGGYEWYVDHAADEALA